MVLHGFPILEIFLIGIRVFIEFGQLMSDNLGIGKVQVTLLPRPRRFGKTLNLSMLKYFFEKNTQAPKRHLFNGLAISQYPEIMARQGQYPVIFITFKDIKHGSWNQCYQNIVTIIAEEYKRLRPNLNLSDPDDRIRVDSVTSETAPESWYHSALLLLSRLLQKAYQQKVILLIDEYDTFIHEAYLKGYYQEAITFARNFLGAGLKDNPHLEQSVLTGILRVAKESLFSGLNNLEVCTFLDQHYADKFGFLEAEVQKLLIDSGLAYELDTIRAWYNGYAAGNCHVYNPWSMVQFMRQGGKFDTYWVNTSQNDLVKLLVRQSGTTFKKEFESLLEGQPLKVTLEESVVFSALEQRASALWTFLLATGYLTFTHWWLDEGIMHAKLAIPNSEVRALYKTIINEWFADVVDLGDYQQMLQELVLGNIQEFKEHFTHLAPQILSSFDVGGKEPEKFYHALVLGMLISLEKTHEIKSNRESGFGRYDVMLIPKDRAKPGIIIEFKKVSQLKQETIETAAQAALAQITNRNYASELHTRGITHIQALAIVFDGKKVLVQEGA